MASNELNADGLAWNQDFPTYQLSKTEIGLHEYDSASRILEMEETRFSNASNIGAGASAAIGSFAIGSMQFGDQISDIDQYAFGTLIFVASIVLTISLFSTKYVAGRHMAVVYASRKVIVLRRMLGLSYGPIRMVLPNWRIEGADNPFSIRAFDGWLSFKCYPYYVSVLFSCSALILLVPAILEKAPWDKTIWVCNQTFNMYTTGCLAIVDWRGDFIANYVAIIWLLILSLTYRRSQFEFHENMILLVGKLLAGALGVKVVRNFEYTLYRAILAHSELLRLDVSLKDARNIVVSLEDKTFYHHAGVSLRGIGRAIVSYIERGKRSGGSTITQQLARTLFIVQPSPIFRRKVVEIFFSFWLETCLEKDEILDLYIASVRYERNVHGILEGMKYFFGNIIPNPSKAEITFLVERISNINSRLLGAKVQQNLDYLLESSQIAINDKQECIRLYQSAVASSKIADDPTFPAISLK